jgi:uncharacterized RDD family membrane protein YckC
MSNWYYVDASGQQVGPISADELRDAVQRGAASQATLAWRDGLAGWQPIAQLAAELGIAPESTVAASSPPASPAAVAPASRPPATEANPYRAPDTESGEGYFEGTDVVFAGFWRRWAALFLDQVIISIPLITVLFFVMLGMGLASGSQPDPTRVIGLQLGYYVVYLTTALFYYASQESSEAQATFGKRALGIKVTDLQGQRIGFKQAAGRWFSAALSYMAMYIGFAMAGFTQRKQALHDLIAGTLVVDRWAYTRFPERQQRGLSIGSLVTIPIIFAIAISQYQDYARRAKGFGYVAPEAVTACVAPAYSADEAHCLRHAV